MEKNKDIVGGVDKEVKKVTLKVDKEKFLNALDTLIPALVTGMTIDVVVDEKGKKMSFTAFNGTDMQLSGVMAIETNSEESQKYFVSKDFVLTAKAMLKLDGDVQLIVTNKTITLMVGVSEYSEGLIEKLPSYNMEKELPSIEFSVNTKEFLEKLHLGGANALKDSMYPGINFAINGDKLELSSVENAKASFTVLDVGVKKCEGERTSFLVPITFFVLKAMLIEETTTFLVMKKYIVVRNGLYLAIVSLVDKNFPIELITNAYSARNIAFTVEVSKKHLLDMMNVLSVTDKVKKSPVCIKKVENDYFLTIHNTTMKIKLECTVTNELVDVYFSYSILQDLVARMGTTVFIKFSSKKQPIWVETKGNEKDYAFLLPVNVI